MKDIRIHSNHANNLCSIKPINQMYEDKIYLIYLFENLYKLTGCLYVALNRPNYPKGQFAKRFEKYNNIINYTNLDVMDDEMSFIYNEKEINRDLFLTIVEMWFEYEQPFFCFIRGANPSFITRQMAWYDVTNNYAAFAIFRGPEEDVMWIGKNSNFSFVFE